MKNLRFGIDGEALKSPLSGVGNYCYQLCKLLEHELPNVQFFVYGRLPESRLALPFSRYTYRRESRALFRRIPSFLWLKTRGRQLAQSDNLDLFWAPRTIHPNLKLPTKTLCTVHDLNHILVPETMERVTKLFHTLWFKHDIANAHWVMANSNGTAERLKTVLNLRVDDIILPGVAPHFRPTPKNERASGLEILKGYGVRPPYLLSVSTLEPRKNMLATIKAFLELKGEGQLREYQLVLVGSKGWGYEAIKSQLTGPHATDVVFTGYVPYTHLPYIYSLASLLVFPSKYEGFGMPALEARACGTASLVTDIPELRQAAGTFGHYVDCTPEAIKEGLKKALTPAEISQPPPPNDMSSFSWEKGAKALSTTIRSMKLGSVDHKVLDAAETA